MATTKQVQAARKNIRKAARAARSKRTISHLPASVRMDLARQAAQARARGGRPGRDYEDRTRAELYEVAKRKNIPGRSKMGKWDLIRALRRAA